MEIGASGTKRLTQGGRGYKKTALFNNLLQHKTEYADIHTRADSDLTLEFQGSPFFQ